jgi:hypothetical protein
MCDQGRRNVPDRCLRAVRGRGCRHLGPAGHGGRRGIGLPSALTTMVHRVGGTVRACASSPALWKPRSCAPTSR